VDATSEKLLQEINNIKIITLKSNYKIERALDELRVVSDARMKDIEISLRGDEKNGIKGVINEVKEHSAYIEKDKKQKWLVRGGLTVFVAVVKFWKPIAIFLKTII
jgi:hypothetical protein